MKNLVRENKKITHSNAKEKCIFIIVAILHLLLVYYLSFYPIFIIVMNIATMLKYPALHNSKRRSNSVILSIKFCLN